MKVLIFALLFSLPTLAAYEKPEEAFEITADELDPTDGDVVQKKEKYMWDESLVAPYNSDYGVLDNRRYTGKDRNKLSASLHLNGQYERLQKLLALEATWLRRSETWHKLWWGATYRRAQTRWNEITNNNQSGGEAAFSRPGDADQTINTLGLGLGYRFKLFLDFWDVKDTFESVQVFGTYNSLAEGHTGDNYTGYGMTADYGLHKRTRQSFFYGGKFTYNIAWVEGPENDRTLSLGWYTFALEAGFLF